MATIVKQGEKGIINGRRGCFESARSNFQGMLFRFTLAENHPQFDQRWSDVSVYSVGDVINFEGKNLRIGIDLEAGNRILLVEVKTRQDEEDEKPIHRLLCAPCGAEMRGRQWLNQDTGFGICPASVERAKSRNDFEPEAFARNYGVEGVHYNVVEADRQKALEEVLDENPDLLESIFPIKTVENITKYAVVEYCQGSSVRIHLVDSLQTLAHIECSERSHVDAWKVYDLDTRKEYVAERKVVGFTGETADDYLRITDAGVVTVKVASALKRYESANAFVASLSVKFFTKHLFRIRTQLPEMAEELEMLMDVMTEHSLAVSLLHEAGK